MSKAANRKLVREQFAAMPLKVLHLGAPSGDTTMGAFYLATRRELISASKLCAALRKKVNAEPDRWKRRAMQAEYHPQITLLQRELYNGRRMTWCGDRMVFAWSWGWAVPKAAKTVAKVYELADRLGVAWPPEAFEEEAPTPAASEPVLPAANPPVFAGALRVNAGQAAVLARTQDVPSRQLPCERDDIPGIGGEE